MHINMDGNVWLLGVITPEFQKRNIKSKKSETFCVQIRFIVALKKFAKKGLSCCCGRKKTNLSLYTRYCSCYCQRIFVIFVREYFVAEYFCTPETTSQVCWEKVLERFDLF